MSKRNEMGATSMRAILLGVFMAGLMNAAAGCGSDEPTEEPSLPGSGDDADGGLAPPSSGADSGAADGSGVADANAGSEPDAPADSGPTPPADGTSCARAAPVPLSGGTHGTGSVAGDFTGAPSSGMCSAAAERVYTFTLTGTHDWSLNVKSDGQLYVHVNSSPQRGCSDDPPSGLCSGPSLAGGGIGMSGSSTGTRTFWVWVSYAGGASTFTIDVSAP